jgi:hypothetical protein
MSLVKLYGIGDIKREPAKNRESGLDRGTCGITLVESNAAPRGSRSEILKLLDVGG